MPKTYKFQSSSPKVFVRIAVSAMVLLIGILGMKLLASLKKPPEQREIRERALSVETLAVELGDYPVFITGYGEVRALNTVRIAPEVMGRVTDVHPRLEPGEIIEPDALLFRIDSTKHLAARDEARAQRLMREATIQRLKTQQRLDRDRMQSLDRNETLAKDAFMRLHSLLEKDEVGTRTAVEGAEQTYNMARDQAALLRRAVELYPIQIQEAESALQAAQARLSRAIYDLDRCEVRVPFAARVKQVDLEAGQLVSSGTPVLTLADDALLELNIPLDSRDARNLLAFKTGAAEAGTAWFQQLEARTCVVRWTESREAHTWPGLLHRVVRFEPETRTLTVAIRVTSREARSGDATLPMTEGMFCSVRIPARPLEDVIRVPRSAVSFDNHVYLAVSNRLLTAAVDVTYADAEHAYVSAGLAAGDEIIVTRLTHPLENSLLSVLTPLKD
jgi:multidrug efflux pump subunit AcrA (membrane-fusion protein)